MSALFKVVLSHASNPDVAGGYYSGKPAEGKKTVEVATLQDAATTCREYIDRHDLGAGNWTGGKVTQNGKHVADVYYNGRVVTK
jgi:hypothetical protein